MHDHGYRIVTFPSQSGVGTTFVVLAVPSQSRFTVPPVSLHCIAERSVGTDILFSEKSGGLMYTSLIRSAYMDPKPKDKGTVSSVIRSYFVALIAFDCSDSHLHVASKAILGRRPHQSPRPSSRIQFQFFRLALGVSRATLLLPQASLHPYQSLPLML